MKSKKKPVGTKKKSSKAKNTKGKVNFVLKCSPISAKRISAPQWLDILEGMIAGVEVTLWYVVNRTTAQRLFRGVDPATVNVTRKFDGDSNFNFFQGFNQDTEFVLLYSDVLHADNDSGRVRHLMLTCSRQLVMCDEHYYVGATLNSRIVDMFSFSPVSFEKFKVWSRDVKKRHDVCLGYTACRKLSVILEDTISLLMDQLHDLRSISFFLQEQLRRVKP